jgi:hypothetical protein
MEGSAATYAVLGFVLTTRIEMLISVQCDPAFFGDPSGRISVPGRDHMLLAMIARF